MNKPYQRDKSTQEDTVIAEVRAVKQWIKYVRNVSLLIIAIMIIAANIWDGDLYRALIRFVILLVATIIICYKSETIFNMSILIHRNGKIFVKKGRRSKFAADDTKQIIKTKRNWLIGQKKVKVPIKAFPDIKEQITEILAEINK
ncbi:hypothetical protein H8E88_21825 [candidate division KSB1 bacterium]|nr:hypothetical protein [candidate division KSB1 bacterium]